MTEPHKELAEAFEAAGWEKLLPQYPDADVTFDGLFSGTFAVFAVLIANAPDSIRTGWTDYQGTLAQLLVDEVIDRKKDVYLVIIVEEVKQQMLEWLHRVLDDSHVCRKICLERRGRDLRETLDDIPFFSTPGTQPALDRELPSDGNAIDSIPAMVRRDLERMSAERILEKLVTKGYEAPE